MLWVTWAWWGGVRAPGGPSGAAAACPSFLSLVSHWSAGWWDELEVSNSGADVNQGGLKMERDPPPPQLPGCAHPVLAGLNQCCPLCQCCCFFQPCPPPPLAVPELVSFLVDVGELPWSRGPGRFLPPQFVFSSPSPYYNPRIHKVWPLGVNVWLPLYICSHLRVLGEVCLCPINGGLFFSPPPPLVFCVLPKNLPALPGDVTIYSWASVINGWADWWVADRRGVIILWMCHLQLVVGTQTENRYATVQRNQALLWPKSGWRWLVLLHGALLSPHGLLFVSLGGWGGGVRTGKGVHF